MCRNSFLNLLHVNRISDFLITQIVFSTGDIFAFHILLDIPSPPLGPLVVTNVTHDSADLEWKKPKDDGGRPILRYIIEHRAITRMSWTKSGTVNGDTTTFTAPDLLEGTEYLFRVIAVNEQGQSQPLEAEATIKPMKKLGKILNL